MVNGADIWQSHVCKAIIYSVVLTLSGKWNRRRLEAPTYAIWVSVLAPFFEQYREQGLLIAPQYAIYQPSEIADADTSRVTTADPGASGVIVDFCLLLPRIVNRLEGYNHINIRNLLNEQGVSEFHNLFHIFRVNDLTIPVIMELKRPPPRHSTSAVDLAGAIYRLLLSAQMQATSQAHCLFSSIIYKEQDEVILIAGTSHWWTWMLSLSKDVDGAFEMEQYERDIANDDFTISLLYTDEPAEDEDVRAEDTGNKAMTKFLPPAAIRKQRDKEREERAQRRNKQRASNERKEFMEKSQPHTTPSAQFTTDMLAEAGLNVHRELNAPAPGVWTGALLLGTPVSNVHLEHIFHRVGQVIAKDNSDTGDE